MVVETKRLVLRNFKEDDLKDFYEMVSQKDVGPRCGWEPYTTEESALEYLRSTKDKPYKFAIVLKNSNKVIGSIEIMDIANTEKYPFLKESDLATTKEIGFFINEDYWNNGYMTEALEVVITTSFEVLNYDSLVASYFEPNAASGRVQAKCGMKIMGKLKEFATWYENNEKCDLVMSYIDKKMYSKIKTGREIEISH